MHWPAPPFDAADDDATTNDERASWAEVALLAFARRTGMAEEMVGDKEDAFFIVSDLLTDLGHWCDRHRLDLAEALVHAAHHYSAETKGYGRQFNP
jgi:hypothetical protein